MTSPYLEELHKELEFGISEKDHPFRYCTLATVGLDHMARLRTVVVRHLTGDFIFSFYTDKRSKKIVHIKENNKVSLLFYHPGKLLQLKVEGLAMIRKDPKLLKHLWKNIEKAARKDYTTSRAPGTILDHPDRLEYLSEEDYFCMVEVHPYKIEYLKLNRPHHLRIRFSRKEDNTWKGEFLVP
jgi:pyridoxine/pyridoxamine 5'-phosphate oxidase